MTVQTGPWRSEENGDAACAGWSRAQVDPGLSRALHKIHDLPDEALDLNVLARTAGMSRTSFAVQFRNRMGVPPAEYLARWRMLKARHLLLQTDLPTSDISGLVGHGSDASFSRAFKRAYSVPPSRVRRLQRSAQVVGGAGMVPGVAARSGLRNCAGIIAGFAFGRRAQVRQGDRTHGPSW